MPKYFTGPYTTTQILSNPTTDNPATVTSTGVIHVDTTSAYAAGIFGDGFAWTLTNLGTVESIGNQGFGIYLKAGGSVTNGQAGSTAGRIAGSRTGLAISGAAGTLANFGTIASYGTAGGSAAVDFHGGGSVTNGESGSTGGIITGVFQAIGITGSAGTVVNYGAISATGTTGVGVNLESGGFVTNAAATALIAGYSGIRLSGPSGAIVNFGTIASTGTGFGAQAVDLLSGGTLTNYGTILGLNTYASGINAGFASDVIVNGAGGLIAGWLNGIDQFSGTGTVINSGTVESTNGDGVYLQAGGSVTNGASGATTALIAGGNTGVKIGGTTGTVSNFGTIAGTTGIGVHLKAGGYFSNGVTGLIAGPGAGIAINGGGGAVANLGTIRGTATNTGIAVFLSGGSVGNGASGVTDALIAGAHSGVMIYSSAGTVTNFGTITGNNTYAASVDLRMGGSVDNRPSGFIEGAGDGIDISGSAGTVTNLGTVAGVYESGVRLHEGGTVANGASGLGGAVIAGGQNGIDILGTAGGSVINGHLGSAAASIGGANYGVFVRDGAGTVLNYGTIAGTAAAGVRLYVGGTVTNAAGALITSTDRGVQIGTIDATLDNSGTVEGGITAAAVYLTAGGSVGNQEGGVIEGGAGVQISGPGTVANLGTVTGTAANGFGVSLLGGSVSNGTGAVTDALISGARSGVQIYIATGTVTNFGTIAASVAYAAAIYLHAGGTVANQPSGLIRGGGDGIVIAGGAGAVANLGAIVGVYDRGVVLEAGGTITNGASAAGTASIAGYSAGVAVFGPGSIANYGTITGTGTGSTGIYLGNGGSVTNGQSGLVTAGISAGHYGIWTRNAAGTVANYGTIAANYKGIYLAAGGTVTNSGLIAGGFDVVFANTAAATIVNTGTILGATGAAIWLNAGGLVTNNALIRGTDDVIFTNNGFGTVVNNGTIFNTGSYGDGVCLDAGGTVVNNGAIQGNDHGIEVNGTAGVVTNYGAIAGITGIGVYLGQGGSIVNGAGASIGGLFAGIRIEHAGGDVTNFGTMSATDTAADGVLLLAGGTVTNHQTGIIDGPATGVSIDNASGTVINDGLISGSGAGYPTGVYLGAGGAVVNSGTIRAVGGPNGVAVNLAQGGTVLNAVGGLLEGAVEAVRIGGASGDLTNFGTLTGGTDGVVLGSGGHTVGNYGRISGGSRFGVFLTAGGSVTNASSGLIEGYKGVLATYVAATVTNFGTITGSGIGVGVELAFSGSTLTNGGTIIGGGGGIAVLFAGGNNRLTVDPGAVFLGLVEGGAAGGDVLELAAGAATGTIGGVGSSFTDFESITVDGAAAWLLTGSNTLGAGTTLSDFGTLEIAGSIVNSGVIDIEAGARLILDNGADGSGSIAFVGTGGTLEIDGSTMPTDPIGGFASGDAIDLRGLTFTSQVSYSFDGSTLSVTGGGITDVLTLTGLAAGTLFTLTADGAGGTLIGITAAGVNLLTNGGFEASTNPVVTPPGWTNIGHSDGVIAYSLFPGQPVYEGREFYDLGGFGNPFGPVGDGIEQTVATTPGTTYTLTFGLSGENAANTAMLRVAVGSQLTDFTLTTTGTGSFTRPFTTQTISYVATGSSTTIAFTILGSSSGNNDPLIDGVDFRVGGGSPPPPPSNLALAPASDSGILGDNITSVIDPVITGTGSAGDTVTLSDEGGVVGTATVALDGTWSIATSTLAEGSHTLTATATDGAGGVSAASDPLLLTIDTTAPVVTAGLAHDTGTPDDGITSDPTVRGTGDPNATVRISVDGAPPISVVADAGGVWSFTPTLADGVHTLTASETDAAGNTGSALPVTFTLDTTVSFFDFVFTYNDGKDYYYGRVADNGTFDYHVGQQFLFGAGRYDIFGKEGAPATVAAGAVFVTNYSHGGPGAATTTPDKTAAGQADGTNGLGSESDFVRGIDGLPHEFSSASAASFVTSALFGFVFSYADGAAFYTGTVAVAPGSTPALPPSDGILGSYSVFAAGLTARAAGTVVIDRFTAGGASYIPSGAGAVAGAGGLGSEAGSVTVGGTPFSFSDDLEPDIPSGIPAVPANPVPDPSDVFTSIVTEIYQEVLGRTPDPGGLAAYRAALAAGIMSAAAVRRDIAGSDEARDLLQGLYHQVFGRNADPLGLAGYREALADGSSLTAVRLILGQSAEAQDDIDQLYHDVLGRDADGGGLTTYMAGLASGVSLAGVRGIVAHSVEAASDLATLFQDILGRAPGAAELVGMEDLLAGSATQQSLQGALSTAGSAGISSAGGFTTITDDPGDDTLTAPPQTPTLFVFSDLSLAHDTIAGFDPARDTIQLPHTLVADLATLKSLTTALGADTLIALTPSQSIQLTNLAPDTLTQANFLFL